METTTPSAFVKEIITGAKAATGAAEILVVMASWPCASVAVIRAGVAAAMLSEIAMLPCVSLELATSGMAVTAG